MGIPTKLTILFLAATNIVTAEVAPAGAVVSDMRSILFELRKVCVANPKHVAACASALVVNSSGALLEVAAVVKRTQPQQEELASKKKMVTCAMFDGDLADMNETFVFMDERVDQFNEYIAKKKYGDLCAETHNMVDFGHSFLRDWGLAKEDSGNAMVDDHSMKSSAPMVGRLVAAPVVGSFVLFNSVTLFPVWVSGAAAMLSFSLTGCADHDDHYDYCIGAKDEVDAYLTDIRRSMSDAVHNISILHHCVSEGVPKCDTPTMESQVMFVKQRLNCIDVSLKHLHYLKESGYASDPKGTPFARPSCSARTGQALNLELLRSLAMKAHQKHDDGVLHFCSPPVWQKEFGFAVAGLAAVGVVAVFGSLIFLGKRCSGQGLLVHVFNPHQTPDESLQHLLQRGHTHIQDYYKHDLLLRVQTPADVSQQPMPHEINSSPQASHSSSKCGIPSIIFVSILFISGGAYISAKPDCPTEAGDLKSMGMLESDLMQMHSFMQAQRNCLKVGRCNTTEMNDLRGELVRVIKNTLADLQLDASELKAALSKDEECLQHVDACTMGITNVHEKKVILLIERVAGELLLFSEH